MMIESTISVTYPLKEPELCVQAIAVDGAIHEIEVTVEGEPVSFNRDKNGFFKNSSRCNLEPAFIAYIERQLSRKFN